MEKLFNPQIRDQAIETTCSNLVMAGVLLQQEVPAYMMRLAEMNDCELAEQLVESRLLLDNYYGNTAKERRN